MVRTVPEKPSQYLVFANINTPRFTTLAYFPVFTKMLLYQKEDKFLTFFVPKQSYCKIIVGLCGNTKKPTFIEQSRLVSYFPSCHGVLSLGTQSACGLSAMCVNQTCLHYPHLSVSVVSRPGPECIALLNRDPSCSGAALQLHPTDNTAEWRVGALQSGHTICHRLK